MGRISTIKRETNETCVEITLNLDGKGTLDGFIPVAFFGHMLAQAAKHAAWDLAFKVRGDFEIDCHHSVEDFGITLGTAIREALGDKKGLRRYGDVTLPMDDALVLCAVDLSGRPYSEIDLNFMAPNLGGMELELVEDFFRALANAAGINIHIAQLRGRNDHHVAEAAFKAFGRAMRKAAEADGREEGVPSTKGVL
ncbi:MAG: imidazoleglycerol-phosphate dehydratase HisB [Defluviitaleaceae bacterium]|nr:imidazoleglycerol-phosphate dehydratase HisB [Defluviitaleaceae bacterium]